MNQESMSRCRVGGCDYYIQPGMLLCGVHWKMLSPELQRSVMRQYRTQQVDPGNYVAAADCAVRYVELYRTLRTFCKAAEARRWLKTRQPALDFALPCELIRSITGYIRVKRAAESFRAHCAKARGLKDERKQTTP